MDGPGNGNVIFVGLELDPRYNVTNDRVTKLLPVLGRTEVVNNDQGGNLKGLER